MTELEKVDPGVIEKFLQELPEKAFHLGLRVILCVIALLVGAQLIRLIRHVLKKSGMNSRDFLSMKFVLLLQNADLLPNISKVK